MSKSTIGGALFAVALAFSGASQAEDAIRWGYAAGSYPPYFSQTASGEYVGFEIELMNALCAKLERECVPTPVAFDGIIAALNAGNLDVIGGGLTINAAREEVIDFTKPYKHDKVGYVAATATPLEISEAGLKGLSLGVQKATIFYDYVSHYFGSSAEIKLYDSPDDITADLLAGRLDVGMLDLNGATQFVKSSNGAFEVKAVAPEDPLLGRGEGFGVRKSDTAFKEQLNEAIAAIRESGEYQAIAAKYFDYDPY